MTTDEKLDKLIEHLETKKSFNPIVVTIVASVVSSLIISIIGYAVSIPKNQSDRIQTLEIKVDDFIQQYNNTLEDIQYNFQYLTDKEVRLKRVYKEEYNNRSAKPKTTK